MSKDWTERELQQASRAMKSMGHMSYEEFCSAVEIKEIIIVLCEEVTPKMNLRPNDTVELADGSRGKVIRFFTEDGVDKCQIKREDFSYETVNRSDIAYRLVHPSEVCPICGDRKSPYDDGCEKCLRKARASE